VPEWITGLTGFLLILLSLWSRFAPRSGGMLLGKPLQAVARACKVSQPTQASQMGGDGFLTAAVISQQAPA